MGRKVLVLLTLVPLAGCGLVERNGAHMGWEARILYPPSIDQKTTTLVQSGPSALDVIPNGHVSGPIEAGQWQSSAGPVRLRREAVQPVPIGPNLTGRQMTFEEWCEISSTLRAPPLAAGSCLPPVRQ